MNTYITTQRKIYNRNRTKQWCTKVITNVENEHPQRQYKPLFCDALIGGHVQMYRVCAELCHNIRLFEPLILRNFHMLFHKPNVSVAPTRRNPMHLGLETVEAKVLYLPYLSKAWIYSVQIVTGN